MLDQLEAIQCWLGWLRCDEEKSRKSQFGEECGQDETRRTGSAPKASRTWRWTNPSVEQVASLGALVVAVVVQERKHLD